MEDKDITNTLADYLSYANYGLETTQPITGSVEYFNIIGNLTTGGTIEIEFASDMDIDECAKAIKEVETLTTFTSWSDDGDHGEFMRLHKKSKLKKFLDE